MSYNVKDVVHINLSLPLYVTEIIRTNEFQRLRNLKQLGVSNYVYASAVHCRDQHCIGTSFLCSELLDILERNSKVKIADLHKKCVIIAGLLHDLGHGPFSHLWEGVVHEGSDKHWTHEQQSVVLIEQLMDVNDIKLDDSPDTHRFALKLINSLIAADQAAWKQLLAPSEMFLTEIVSNKFCNIDVDKCDYILRDGHHVKQFVVLKPFINFLQRARIVHDDSGTSHIGYHVDDFELIENLFYNRAYLHMNVYQHFQVAGTERMVRDVCVKADAGGVTIDGLPLTEVQRDLSAYLKLDDSVIDLIRASPIDNQQVRDAQDIIGELDGERLYTLVWESTDSPKVLMDALTKKFGPIFRDVHKVIPYAEVPPNVPLYNDAGQAVMMTSNLRLSFRSTMIFCVKHDSELVRNVKNFIDSLNNNNEV